MLNRKSNNTKLIMETWRRFINEGTDITQQMTNLGHEAWLKDYRSKTPNEPRHKPMPDGFNASLEELQRRGFGKEQGVEEIDGIIHQDINRPANELIPELNDQLNGKPAKGYNKAMNEVQINSVEDIEKLADKFHEVWMECFPWNEKNHPEMFVPYSQLSRDNKIKDLVILEVAIKAMYGENSSEHELLQQVMNNV